MRSFLFFLLFLALAFGAAAFGTLFPPGGWYQSLAKPAWNPPSWIFGPVWTTLYFLMAVAAWLVWRTAGWSGRGGTALAVFLGQLVLNGMWSWLFFGLYRPGWAFAEILLLWIAILATIVLFWRIRPLAGALLLPYLAWVSFAAVLNGTLWRMNIVPGL